MAHKLRSVLRTSPDLHPVLAQVGRLQRLQAEYQRLAPASLAASSQVVRLDNACLTLLADNAAVAAKLRQLGPSLAGDLRSRGIEVDLVRVRVGVRNAPPPKAPAQRLGDKARQEVAQLAESLEDTELGAALAHLLAHSR